MVSIVSSQ